MDILTFKIGLSGTYWNKRPQYSIMLNDVKYQADTVQTASDETFYVQFSAELDTGIDHVLKVRLENKTPLDTVVQDGAIVSDMLLNIVSIEVDDIDLGAILWTHSHYYTDHPHKVNDQIVTHLDRCVNLGWNGSYQLKFDTPFYIWLLENI